MDNNTVLEVQNLTVSFYTEQGRLYAVNDVSYKIPRGKTLAIIGESGCGKTVTALSIMRLIPSPPGRIDKGRIIFNDCNLIELSETQLQNLRGNQMGMIFQEPMTSLNPVFTVGDQIMESIIFHQKKSKAEARSMAIDLLAQVGIPSPSIRIDEYPHQMSGGMKQRVMIAMAISCQPDLLIADEPTTALDVSMQAQIIELLYNLQKTMGMSILLITHDLGVVAEMADYVAVMYASKIVEYVTVEELFHNPLHPYTQGLFKSLPRLGTKLRTLIDIPGQVPNPLKFPPGCNFWPRCNRAEAICKEEEPQLKENNPGHYAACWLIKADASSQTETVHSHDGAEFCGDTKAKSLLEVRNLKKLFPVKKGSWGRIKGWVRAVDDVSFDIKMGQTVGLVGESGCGKTTLGRTVLRLIEPSAGEVYFNNQSVLALDPGSLRRMRRKMQIIFQDPYSSLNPRMTVGTIVGESLSAHNIAKGEKRRSMVAELFDKVGLSASYTDRYPHEFSGGQRQRICIARALALNPSFIVCDEAVSALDVSIQAQIINLLMNLQKEMSLSYLFIAHNLAVVEHIASRVLIMYLGQIVEDIAADDLAASVKHPYSKALLSSNPVSDPAHRGRSAPLKGDIPSPLHIPSGCCFHPRCPIAKKSCETDIPQLTNLSDKHLVRCPWI
ncbi:MAG: dipeptide ABC transporter ATP-binding protein [bacterium]